MGMHSKRRTQSTGMRVTPITTFFSCYNIYVYIYVYYIYYIYIYIYQPSYVVHSAHCAGAAAAAGEIEKDD